MAEKPMTDSDYEKLGRADLSAFEAARVHEWLADFARRLHELEVLVEAQSLKALCETSLSFSLREKALEPEDEAKARTKRRRQILRYRLSATALALSHSLRALEGQLEEWPDFPAEKCD